MKKTIDQFVAVETFKGEGKNYRKVWQIFQGHKFISQCSSLTALNSNWPGIKIDKGE